MIADAIATNAKLAYNLFFISNLSHNKRNKHSMKYLEMYQKVLHSHNHTCDAHQYTSILINFSCWNNYSTFLISVYCSFHMLKEFFCCIPSWTIFSTKETPIFFILQNNTPCILIQSCQFVTLHCHIVITELHKVNYLIVFAYNVI